MQHIRNIYNAYYEQIWSKNFSACFSWNLVPRLIQACRIQLWCSLVGQIWSKRIQICNLNIHYSMVMFTSTVVNQKYPFWTNLFQKLKIVCLSRNLVPRLIQICRIQWRCSRFLFSTGNTFFREIRSETENFLFKLKFAT